MPVDDVEPARHHPCPAGVRAVPAVTRAMSILRLLGRSAQPLPLSAACHLGEKLYIRLSGSELGVAAACQKLNGKQLEKDDDFWHDIREHRHRFFQDAAPLWRLSVPPATPAIHLPGKWLHDWGGAQRWLKSEAPGKEIQQKAESVGGYATLFRRSSRAGAQFPPLPKKLIELHRNIKLAFDPTGTLNREVFSPIPSAA